jgi:Flp pilus assembly protein TadB
VSDEDSGATENYSQAVSTRLTPSTKERYDRFRDEHELGNAQTLRRLVRVALKQEQTDTRPAERSTARAIASVFIVVFAVLVYLGEGAATRVVLVIHLLAIWVWASYPVAVSYLPESVRDRLPGK